MSSSKERTKKYRERLKENEEKYKVVKKKDRERKKKDYLKKKATQPEVLRAKEREKKRKQRKNMAELMKKTAKSTSKVSPQMFGKALSRAKKHLPRCPERKVQVLAKMVQDLSPRKRKAVVDLCDNNSKRRKEQDKERKKRCDALTDDEVQQVQDFYLRDDISRMLPGKKDYVSVKQADGKREHRQKRLLLLKIGEAHELFKEESNVQIGKSKFAELRPPQVIPSTSFDQEVCICKYHENIDLLLHGLSRLGTSDCTSSEEAVAQTACSLDSCKCIDRVCDSCGVTELTDHLFEGLDEDDSISYYQWQKVEGVVKKHLVDCTIAEAKEDLQAQLRPFSRHVYNIRRQFQELRHLKEQLNQDEIIIHEGFSENFQLKHQREIMASHWSNESVTVFTAVVYYKDHNKDLKHLSYALISDELSHDKGSVYVFNKALLDAVSKNISFKQVHYWSDGAGSQFKNRFNLASVLYHPHDFGTQATWSFFETAHGKGAVDGVGGAVKRAVWRAILQDRAVVNSAEEFAKVAENECLKVQVLYIPKEDITQAKEQLFERWNACISIPETHSIHYVTKLSDTTVSVAKNSQFLKQDTCTEHVLLSSFSLKPIVGDSATTNNNIQKPQSGTDRKPASEKDHKTGSEKTQNPVHDKGQNPGSQKSQIPGREKDQNQGSRKRQNPGNQKSQKSDSDNEVEIVAESSPLQTVSSTCSFKLPVNIKIGLPQAIKTRLSFETSFNLPCYQEPVVAALLAEAVAFRGDPLISIEDLKALSGEEASDSEDMWLPNFIIDAYLNLLSATNKNVITIKWERFEKSSDKKLGGELLKKGKVSDYNLILVPCNEVGNNHWFLLCVYPKVQHVVVLDSAAGEFIKPAHQRAITKMWRALVVVSGERSPSDWSFYVNSDGDVLQQETDYDCGVFVCMFSRALALTDPLILNADIMDVRKSIIHDLHFQSLSPVPSVRVQVGMYYAVDYVTTFYFGRVTSVEGRFVELKFLHSKSSTTYDWPRTDDVDRVHCSCIFYGPVLLEGNRPFTISTQREVEKVHFFIRKQHKL